MRQRTRKSFDLGGAQGEAMIGYGAGIRLVDSTE